MDKAAVKARKTGGFIDRGPVERDWADGNDYLLFKDPDWIDYIPGRRLLTEAGWQSPGDDLNWDQHP